MQKPQLDRLMRIAQKTNSPVVVLDENNEEMVVLPLSAYEALLDEECDCEEYYDLPDGLFPDEVEGDSLFDPEEPGALDEFELEPSILDEGQDVEPHVVEEIEEELEQKPQFKAENSVEKEAEPSEEQFYLEPIE